MSGDGSRNVTFVLPIYNEEGNIPRLYERLDAVASVLNYGVEMIFINDGSTDNSLNLLTALQDRDQRVTIIDLARNFGHQLAVTAGLDASTGDAVIVLDSDMQDPPEICLELVKRWEAGYDVVYAQRRTRKDTAFKKWTAAAFYRLLGRVADVDIPPNTGDFRLMDRRVVDEVNKYREHDRFLRGMVSHVGFKQVAVQFDRDERFAGTSGYPLRKMFKLAAAGILGFSTFPLTLISRVGFGVAALSICGVLYAMYMKIFVPAAVVEGWTFIVISILFMGGLQLIMLGILGGYIGRIYTEVQDRPLYSVREIRGNAARTSRRVEQASEL
ncbi:glycosyltransferase involved in cell wall biosynthesis [Arthrobacter sp. B2I5]|uniref:glycosyltransferase family 2 protein n=1 Tax=Arthrobacter sp. B2I5 TaxID=3042266 RepID=UPI0027855BD6|nr:glycosyltransferase family 2 protein [Arthrobacter sp. B2I5]MDQ0827257.1 glycosyltransferase involved in cell wall biosynthesis [Arthrobacter sp. B2I5]